MKVAIVHDVLRHVWGAERIIATLARIYPSADIYTSVANRKTVKLLKLDNHKIYSSIINSIPPLNWKNSLVQMLSPLIWKSFKFRDYGLVISSSGFALTNLIKTGPIPHIQYIHSPPKNIFSLTPKWTLQKIIPYDVYLAKKYKLAIRSSPYVATNSEHMKRTLKKMFSINSTVIYPPVVIPKGRPNVKSKEYFISIGRLDPAKSVDLAILACNRLKLPLKIVGVGPSLNALKRIAGPTIKFLDFVPDKKLKSIFDKSKAFLFCAENEDFGIAPIESLAHGVPVIAYYGAGVKETLIDNKTGLFFHKHTVESLIATIKKFKPDNFDSLFLYKHAKKFSEERFTKEFKKYVSKVLNQGYTDK